MWRQPVRVGQPAPLGLAVAFARTVDDHAVLRDLALVEGRVGGVLAVLVERQLGDDLGERAAVIRVPGGVVQLIDGDAGLVQHVLVVDDGDRVPVLGQAEALAVAGPQVSQAAQVDAEIDVVTGQRTAECRPTGSCSRTRGTWPGDR